MRYSTFSVLRRPEPLNAPRLTAALFSAALYLAPYVTLGLAVGHSLLKPAQARTVTSELTESETAELIVRSLGLLGVEYRFGGSTPAGGLDCSGFVRHVYQEALGLRLPRTTEQMSAVGVAVDRTRLLPGDLVFFNTLQRPFSHVGLYLGDDRFVHAPSTGNVIRIEPLSARYWAQRFEGARRVAANSPSSAQDRAGLDQLILARSTPAAHSLIIPHSNLRFPADIISSIISNH